MDYESWAHRQEGSLWFVTDEFEGTYILWFCQVGFGQFSLIGQRGNRHVDFGDGEKMYNYLEKNKAIKIKDKLEFQKFYNRSEIVLFGKKLKETL